MFRLNTTGSPDLVPVAERVAVFDNDGTLWSEQPAPVQSFTFSPAGAAVYQLGPFGTAARKLKEWELKP